MKKDTFGQKRLNLDGCIPQRLATYSHKPQHFKGDRENFNDWEAKLLTAVSRHFPQAVHDPIRH